ncbi:MAG: DNA adenine methylase [Polyangiaceae bacterium]
MRPFLKWAGGKTKLLPELVSRLPREMRTYAEPFCGGGALFFALAEERKNHRRTFERAILADRNEELVVSYNAIKTDVGGVIEALGPYVYDRDLFYATRKKDPKTLSSAERAARLIFLNRTCFNGLWRVNSKGEFNVPFGRYKNPTICDERTLRAASEALQDATILHADFAEVTRELGGGAKIDFVYFDPPYAPVSETADFTAYAAGGFGFADQERLARELAALRDRGAMGMLSNADTPNMRVLYKEFGVHVVAAPRAINSDPTKRGVAAELVVTTWDEPGQIEEARRPAAASAVQDGA